jgi:hypothetical protein
MQSEQAANRAYCLLFNLPFCSEDEVRSYKTLVNIYQITWLHIAKDSHHFESFKSHKYFYLCHCIQTSSGTHPALYPMGSKDSFIWDITLMA